MGAVEAAITTQLANIEKRTGKSLAQLVKLVKASGLTKNGEIRDHLKARFELGYGDANALTKSCAQIGWRNHPCGAERECQRERRRRAHCATSRP